MTAGALELEAVSAWFGAERVLDGVGLSIPAGRVTALIGSAGAGKTTLLRVCNRLAELEPDFRLDGRVSLDGQDLDSRDPAELRRSVGLIFERPTAFAASLQDNVAFGLSLAGVSGVERSRRIEAALRRTGLWGDGVDLSAPATALDVGARQRLCLARALALQPQVLMLDEPTRWLHPADAARIEAIIADLRGDITVIWATNDAAQAGRVADDVALLESGRLIEYGPTERVFTAPSEPATEAYLSRRFR